VTGGRRTAGHPGGSGGRPRSDRDPGAEPRGTPVVEGSGGVGLPARRPGGSLRAKSRLRGRSVSGGVPTAFEAAIQRPAESGGHRRGERREAGYRNQQRPDDERRRERERDEAERRSRAAGTRTITGRRVEWSVSHRSRKKGPSAIKCNLKDISVTRFTEISFSSRPRAPTAIVAYRLAPPSTQTVSPVT
jgi:hypothetical protein